VFVVVGWLAEEFLSYVARFRRRALLSGSTWAPRARLPLFFSSKHSAMLFGTVVEDNTSRAPASAVQRLRTPHSNAVSQHSPFFFSSLFPDTLPLEVTLDLHARQQITTTITTKKNKG
jgi:hypothetical protein